MTLKLWLASAVAAALAACAAPPAIERVSPPGGADNLRRQSTEVLFWDDATRADRFRRMEDFFPGIEVAPSPRPRALPAGPALPPSAAGALDAYLARGDVAGVMVLQDGRVRYERYGLGFGPGQRWTSFDAAETKGRLPAGFDRRFCDLWRFYLMYCEGGFRGGAITVSQVTLTKR